MWSWCRCTMLGRCPSIVDLGPRVLYPPLARANFICSGLSRVRWIYASARRVVDDKFLDLEQLVQLGDFRSGISTHEGRTRSGVDECPSESAMTPHERFDVHGFHGARRSSRRVSDRTLCCALERHGGARCRRGSLRADNPQPGFSELRARLDPHTQSNSPPALVAVGHSSASSAIVVKSTVCDANSSGLSVPTWA